MTPADATVEWECDYELSPEIDNPCYYFERSDDSSIIVKEIINIEVTLYS